MPRLWHLLYWSAFLHDYGKVLNGFQAQLRSDGIGWGHRHEVFSLAFVDLVSGDLSTEEQQWLVASIVSHHRDFEEIQRIYPIPDLDDEDPLQPQLASLEGETLRGLWRWLSECGIPWRDNLELTDLGIFKPGLPAEQTAIESVQQHGVERIRHWLKVYRRLNRDLRTEMRFMQLCRELRCVVTSSMQTTAPQRTQDRYHSLSFTRTQF